MLLNINSISAEGKTLALGAETDWFQHLLRQRFSDLDPDGPSASGEIEIHKTLQNLSLSGELRVKFSPTCARCGQVFQTVLEVPLQRHMVPYFSGPREEMFSAEEEVELSAEDLEFSFYHGEEIDLAALVAEEITLALPIRFLCQEDCRGLCPSCGTNLNQGKCTCSRIDEFSPFSVLKRFQP